MTVYTENLTLPSAWTESDSSLYLSSPDRLDHAPEGEDLTMPTTEKPILYRVLEDCAKDLSLRERLKRDPQAVLSEYGVPMPSSVDIVVVENTATKLHIVLPTNPDVSDIHDDELLEPPCSWQACKPKGSTGN